MHIIRIELHNTTDYTSLHLAMQVRAMQRAIPCADGTARSLPSGTYYHNGNGTAAAVLASAQDAARSVGHVNAMIVVADASAIQILNLPVATGYRMGA
jgi:hypothetical protein